MTTENKIPKLTIDQEIANFLREADKIRDAVNRINSLDTREEHEIFFDLYSMSQEDPFLADLDELEFING